MAKMMAARLVEIGKPLQLVQVEIPEPGPGEVLVKVKAAGICSSDLHYQDGRSRVTRLPLTLGHEIAGEVAALGAGTEGLQPGERVCLFYLVTCGECLACSSGFDNRCPRAEMLGKNRDGGFAEYVTVPAATYTPFQERFPSPKLP